MQIHKLVAAALRGRAAYQAGTDKAVADAIEPASTEEAILKIALGADDLKGIVTGLADYFDAPISDAPVVEVPSAIASAQAAVAGVAAQSAPEATIRILDADEIIKEGDEWCLRDGLHHHGGRPSEWKVVGNSVGRPVSDFPDSIFRRH